MLTAGNLACVPCTKSVTSPSRSQIMAASSPTATLSTQAFVYGAADVQPPPAPAAPAPCMCKQRRALLVVGALVLVYLLAKR